MIGSVDGWDAGIKERLGVGSSHGWSVMSFLRWRSQGWDRLVGRGNRRPNGTFLIMGHALQGQAVTPLIPEKSCMESKSVPLAIGSFILSSSPME